MPKTYVALDLETTGLEPSRDEIIEIGAVRFDRDHVIEEFSTLVNPGRPIPPFIVELTGITNRDVKDAIGSREATRQTAEFVGRDPVIGHNVGFDLAFMHQHGVLRRSARIDTFELAGILVPHASRYSLNNLVHDLGLTTIEQTHRALDDAQMTQALFLKLLDRASQMPEATLKEIIQLGRRVHWGPARFFGDALYNRRRYGTQGALGAQLAGKLRVAVKGQVSEERTLEPLRARRDPKPIDLDALTTFFDEGGPISQVYPQYEYREQQVRMMQAVGEAFNESRHLMVEAGTGTGKSLAYLLPAIEWAVLNDRHVVISTNTINLQEQLVDKDIPQLADVLYEFRYQILKGRSHYLCMQQLAALRQRGPRSEDEMRVLAKVLYWLPSTIDGDGDDLFLPTPNERRVWHELSAASEACDPEHCRIFHEGRCFFYQARAKAEGAHLIIVNHALLLADLATQNRVLPDYPLLIVDEAHHLESAATDSMRYTVTWPALDRALGALLHSGRSYDSLFQELLQVGRTLSPSIGAKIYEEVQQLGDQGRRLQRGLDSLFSDAEGFLNERVQQRGGYGIRLRMVESTRQDPGWDQIYVNWSRLEPDFDRFTDRLSRLTRGLEDLTEAEAPELETLRIRLMGLSRMLGEAHLQLDQFIRRPARNAIYWLSMRRGRALNFNVAPLNVGTLIQQHLLDRKRSVILTSATLRVEGVFDYMRDRLGAETVGELAVGSPFDYPSVALLYMVNDIPEPGSRGYQKTLEETLIDLFKATEGRALALFTSYSQLKATTTAITEPLAKEGITVYSQGSGTSRSQLLESFREDERVVLLGTRSFWEGVDVPGEALSCLVIAKLPFDVPSDPIVSARAEAYESPFHQYMVPEAILRFMQGFGRLIRTAGDQGIAVVLDRRLLSKGYGQRFIASLPDPRIHVGSKTDLPAVAEQWVNGHGMPASVYGGEAFDQDWDLSNQELYDSDEGKDPPWFWGA
jgi:DNA polymerase-3 subunit epsilon/ATP-dependent DNA helicase DinG